MGQYMYQGLESTKRIKHLIVIPTSNFVNHYGSQFIADPWTAATISFVQANNTIKSGSSQSITLVQPLKATCLVRQSSFMLNNPQNWALAFKASGQFCFSPARLRSRKRTGSQIYAHAGIPDDARLHPPAEGPGLDWSVACLTKYWCVGHSKCCHCTQPTAQSILRPRSRAL